MKHPPRKQPCPDCGNPMRLEQLPWAPWSSWFCTVCVPPFKGRMRTVRVKHRGRKKTVHWNRTKGQ